MNKDYNRDRLIEELIEYVSENDIDFMLLDLVNLKVLKMCKYQDTIIDYLKEKLISKYGIPSFYQKYINWDMLINEYVSKEKLLIVSADDDNYNYTEYLDHVAFLIRENKYDLESAYLKIDEYINEIKEYENGLPL